MASRMNTLPRWIGVRCEIAAWIEIQIIAGELIHTYLEKCRKLEHKPKLGYPSPVFDIAEVTIERRRMPQRHGQIAQA